MGRPSCRMARLGFAGSAKVTPSLRHRSCDRGGVHLALDSDRLRRRSNRRAHPAPMLQAPSACVARRSGWNRVSAFSDPAPRPTAGDGLAPPAKRSAKDLSSRRRLRGSAPRACSLGKACAVIIPRGLAIAFFHRAADLHPDRSSETLGAGNLFGRPAQRQGTAGLSAGFRKLSAVAEVEGHGRAGRVAQRGLTGEGGPRDAIRPGRLPSSSSAPAVINRPVSASMALGAIATGYAAGALFRHPCRYPSEIDRGWHHWIFTTSVAPPICGLFSSP